MTDGEYQNIQLTPAGRLTTHQKTENHSHTHTYDEFGINNELKRHVFGPRKQLAGTVKTCEVNPFKALFNYVSFAMFLILVVP